MPAEAKPLAPMPPKRPAIDVRGARVHNLKGIDLSIPLQRLTVITGVSGSGKSSLAFDTLFAEGQRRYLESFTISARQLLTRWERPEVERIDHVPPAIAFRQDAGRQPGRRATIAKITEIDEALRTLFARLGTVVCSQCRRLVRRETPDTITQFLGSLAAGTRFQIAIPIADDDQAAARDALSEAGFTRFLEAGSAQWAIVDRLTAGASDVKRTREAAETAFQHGGGRCSVLWEARSDAALADAQWEIAGQEWQERRFSEELACSQCGATYLDPDARLFSDQSPLGACRECHGAGATTQVCSDALWTRGEQTVAETLASLSVSVAGKALVDELVKSMSKARLTIDRPIQDLSGAERAAIGQGAPRKKWIGLDAVLQQWAGERHRPGVRGLLRAFSRTICCPHCAGMRLRPEALVIRLAFLSPDAPANAPNIAELRRKSIAELAAFCDGLPEHLDAERRTIASPILDDLKKRTVALLNLGIGEPALDRPLRTLSDGEARKVALAGIVSSALVQALYVLDEPSAGMAPADAAAVRNAVQELQRRRNTVVLVEHQETFLAAADHVIEIGPGAGREGGHVVFAGTPESHRDFSLSTAADGDATSADAALRPRRNDEIRWRMRLSNCRRNNLKNITVEIPLGVLSVVSGPAGSGKTSLVGHELYDAVKQWLRDPDGSDRRLEIVEPDGRPANLPLARPLEACVLVDQSPLPGSLRTTPATCVKAFDEVRRLFAQTSDAQVRNYGPARFSFNAREGGRCPKCEGTGELRIDLQFLADLTLPCPECRGSRYQRDILQIRYRGMNIDEVLRLSVRDAWSFFARQPRIVRRLQPLRDVGLDYLPLGQPVSTLSGGERQRLKLAIHLAGRQRQRTLFLLDGPSAGLHRRDVAVLVRCLRSLLDVGHSVIVVDNHPEILSAAEWRLELGPGSGSEGGQIVSAGPVA